MEKDEGSAMPAMFTSLDYSLDQLQPLKNAKNSESVDHHNLDSNPMGNVLVDMFNFHLSASSGGGCSAANNSLDKLSFADVMQFADYGPKLALNQAMDDQNSEVGREFDPIYFLKFPVLAEKADQQLVLAAGTGLGDLHQHGDHHIVENNYMDRDRLMPSVCLRKGMMISPSSTHGYEEDLEPGNHLVDQVPTSEDVSLNLKHTNSTNTTEKLGHDNDNQEQQIVISLDAQKNIAGFSSSANCRSEPPQSKPKRKRSRATKNSEEVESQRMTHIAVERNRRKQMNEHLRVLRSLMPGSYVQRGDQASIIGGAIEFVRELEQLLQCLESQKRRRLMYAEASARPSPTTDAPACLGPIQSSFPVFPAVLQPDFKYFEGNLYEPLREDIADNKSPVADIEVKLVGCDAMIKILSQRRPGQLLKTIAALENLHFSILHTNVTTIEQTVLYSFNVKVGGDCRLSADDIASSVQQIFNMLHAANMGYINE